MESRTKEEFYNLTKTISGRNQLARELTEAVYGLYVNERVYPCVSDVRYSLRLGQFTIAYYIDEDEFEYEEAMIDGSSRMNRDGLWETSYDSYLKLIRVINGIELSLKDRTFK